GELVQVVEGIQAEFIDAGHLLGSASVRFTCIENGITKTIVFSGDIGNKNQPIIRDPQYFFAADYVLTESTYGDRLHDEVPYKNDELAKIFDETFRQGGNVIIPSFAVGRTQELLYHIREIKEKQLVKSIPDFPVYVDSPLAFEATNIYECDMTGYADDETLQVLKAGFRPLYFSNLNLCQTTQESIALNQDAAPKVIISSSGMCEAGRIRHHLKHNLWRKECAILFVGYQANGTLGKMLLDGATQVKLFGEPIAVKASMHNFAGLSAHADKNGLLEWINSYKVKPQKVFVVHGEEDTCLAYTETLKQLGYNAMTANFEMEYDLAADVIVQTGISIDTLMERGEKHKESPAYGQLEATGQQLLQLIRQKKGMSNRDIEHLSGQIAALISQLDK
ncbi:MAG: MBL fold metallo-hydrolase, partial [Eubacteriales bacterium]